MMKWGYFMMLLVYMVYRDLHKPAFYVNGEFGDICSGNDTSTCGGSPSTQYVCMNDRCRCDRKNYYVDDDGNCIQYKDPIPPSRVEIVDVTATNFTVTWTKPEYPGPMLYFFDIFEAETRNSEIADEHLDLKSVREYNTTTHVYSNRVAGDWTYRVAVRVHTLNNKSSNKTFSEPIRTPTAQAGQVNSFRIIVLGTNRSKAEIWWRCPNEKDRNGLLTNYTIEMKLNQANNKDYLGKELVEQYIAEEATPHLSVLHEAIIKYDPISTTETTVTFQYCSKCLLDDSNGAITFSALLMCHFKYCKDNRLETIDEQVIRKFTTWKQAKEAGFNSPFLVTKGDWIKLSNDSDFSTFVAGNEEGCDEKPADVVCNGPLEPDTSYRAIAFTCTSVGCSYTYLGGAGWYTTQGGDRTRPILAGVLGTLAALSLIAAIVVLYKKGMLPCSSKHKPYSVPQVEKIKM